MLGKNYFFTSESVTEGHPDKIADQISDAILDSIIAKDPFARVACETLVTTGLAFVAGEVTTNCYVEIPDIGTERGLSLSFRLMNTLPDNGIILPDDVWDFPYARPKSSSMPITSPVDFISGPSIVSTP